MAETLQNSNCMKTGPTPMAKIFELSSKMAPAALWFSQVAKAHAWLFRNEPSHMHFSSLAGMAKMGHLHVI